MSNDVDTECYDLLKRVDAENLDDDGDVQQSSLHQFNLASISHTTQSNLDVVSKNYLTLQNVQFSRAPTKDICSLAVSTFEKMKITNLRSLERMNDNLKANGKIGTDELMDFTMKIMAEVWQCDEKLTALLRTDPLLTETLGRELLVLFDNVMSDPVYGATKTGKPQRYTKACLDNSIQPMYGENVPGNKWNTYETVISTYTSPTAFTPEMESLMKTAVQLGISTNDLNLKKFVTERSLSAFLKTLIQAKLKKHSFIKQFNSKLLGVLHHTPEMGTPNKFKYSFSKLYRYVEPKVGLKSSPVTQQTLLKQKLATNRSVKRRYNTNKRDLFDNERIGDFLRPHLDKKKAPNCKKTELPETLCNKCHEPFRYGLRGDRGIAKSLSDSCLSLNTCDSITCCLCFDNARKAWDKRKILISKTSKFAQRKKRSNLKAPVQPAKDFKAPFREDGEERFGLLTEQRSFFRLGEGALRDALSEYVEAKNTNAQNEETKKVATKKKKVRWIDETSISSIYGSLNSLIDSSSELLVLQETSFDGDPCCDVMEKIVYFLVQGTTAKSQALALADRPLKGVFVRALVQATFVTAILWLCFVIYICTPDIAERLRHLKFTTWLQLMKRNPIV